MADLRVDGQDEPVRVKVRNLSNGGMMAEAACRPLPGASVSVNLRNVGWVEGSVAWIQEGRFGIAFHQEVDARLVRQRCTDDSHCVPSYVRTATLPESRLPKQPLRKV